MKVAVEEFKAYLSSASNVDKYSKYLKDIIVCWWAILISVLVAFLLGFVYMLIVFCCAKILVWAMIGALLTAMLAIAALLFFYADHYDAEDNTRKYMKWGSYFMLGLTAVYLTIIICCF